MFRLLRGRCRFFSGERHTGVWFQVRLSQRRESGSGHLESPRLFQHRDRARVLSPHRVRRSALLGK